MVKPYGIIGGNSARLFTLKSHSGKLEVGITDFGARIVSLEYPDRLGRIGELACRYKDPTQFATDSCYFGPTVGRFANRIGAATFLIDGVAQKLTQNEGNNTLHGGHGFDKRTWSTAAETDSSVTLQYVSPDGESGFTGELTTTVCFSIASDELTISYSATTTKPTAVNLTNHAYINLAGAGSGNVFEHTLRIDAQRYTEVDAESIPTGRLLEVEGTPLDFRVAKPIGHDIRKLGAAVTSGYDHNFVLNALGTAPQIELRDPSSGRLLKISTSKPGVQLYTGNFLDGSIEGSEGKIVRHGALCLETQNFPDAPNHANFPNSILRPGEKYQHWTKMAFGAE